MEGASIVTKMETMEPDTGPASRRLVPDRFEDFYLAEWDSVYRPLAATIGDPRQARDATASSRVPRFYVRWRRRQP